MNEFDEYPLDPSYITAFEADGHVLLRGVADPGEIDTFRPAIARTCTENSTEGRDIDDRDTYGKAFLQVTNLWTRNEAVRRFVFMRRFASIAARLLNAPHVRLYHDQALFKEPGGGPTPWHQDKFYWPLDSDRTITMWMPLVDIDIEMGMITFASGSHKLGAATTVEISDQSDRIYGDYVRKQGFAVSAAGTMKAGDATFHHGWTVHCAGPNLSGDKMREVMTVIYYDSDARVTAPTNEFQQADLNAWLDGKLPGEAADGRLNPVLA